MRPLAQRLPVQDKNLAAIQPEDTLRLKVPQDPADNFAHTAQLISEVLMRCGNHRTIHQQQRRQPLIQPAERHGIDEFDQPRDPLAKEVKMYMRNSSDCSTSCRNTQREIDTPARSASIMPRA